jgi:hypothetical protein
MVLRQIFDRLIIGGVLVGSAFAYEAIAVLICGILVGGSALPVAIRAYRKKKNRSGRLETMIDCRLSDLEERLIERLSDMEYRNAQLVESVEERVDFAQQLMASRDPEPEEKPMGLPIVKPVRVGRFR